MNKNCNHFGQRITIIGSGGSGKSTLSLLLSKELGIPVYHLDQMFWRENWICIPREELAVKVEELVKEESWIIEGNYVSNLETRLKRADTVIFLDFNRMICFYRVFLRNWIYRGKTRPDMSDGCIEKIDLEFLVWLWNFPKETKPEMLKLLEKYPKVNLIRIRKKRELSLMVKNIST